MKRIFAIACLTTVTSCTGSSNAELQCLSSVIHATIDADKKSNPDTVEGAMAIAAAEVGVLRTVSTDGCTAEQRSEIMKMAQERQVLVDVGQHMQGIRSGTIKSETKAQELANADRLEAATESYQSRFDKLTNRMTTLADASKR